MASNIFDTKQDTAGPGTESSRVETAEEMLVALRRVIRAVDIHSRRLVHTHGLTGPQAVVLKEVVRAQRLTSGELAKRVSLGPGTVTEIVKRLEARQLLRREPSAQDRRRVLVSATDAGRAMIASSPPLLQETFVERFSGLKDWEQGLLLAAMQRVAELMDAEQIDAAPLLSSGSIDATPQAVEAAITPANDEPASG